MTNFEMKREDIERRFIENRVSDWESFKSDVLWLVALRLYDRALEGNLHLQVLHSKHKVAAIELIKNKMSDFSIEYQRDNQVSSEFVAVRALVNPNFLIKSVTFSEEEISQISRTVVH